MQNECENWLRTCADTELGGRGEHCVETQFVCAWQSCGAQQPEAEFESMDQLLQSPAGIASSWAHCFYNGDESEECLSVAAACEG